MLNEDYIRFQRLVFNHRGDIPSFKNYKKETISLEYADPEIEPILTRINMDPNFCTDSDFGSCLGYHNDMDSFPHVSIWYDSSKLLVNEKILGLIFRLNIIKTINISSEFSRSSFNPEGYYERTVVKEDIPRIQHIQINVSSRYNFLKDDERKRIAYETWKTIDSVF